MLYIDGDHVSLADLSGIDPEVVDIATAEGISLDAIIAQTWGDCGDEIQAATQSFTSNVSRVALREIVMSGTLRRWMTYKALALFYRAATNRRVTDRYEAKLERIEAALNDQWRLLWANGIPLATAPLYRPGATHASAGSFGLQNISAIPGGSEPGRARWVRITWVDARYTFGGGSNGESAPSEIAAIEIPAAHVLRVSIAGLIPPSVASGWNVYAGDPNGATYLQNSIPIPISDTAWTNSTESFGGMEPGDGQPSDRYEQFASIFPRM
ncbi:MAG: hypothetical protein IT168_33240 [Bryobacterales bacterium]|nr:hypothetical protein [Bryobacterales bacterium]